MNEKNQTIPKADRPPTGRLILGGAIFIFGFIVPVFTPLLMATDLPVGWKATIAGLMIFGIPETFMIMAVGVLGKSGYAFLKEKFYKLFRKIAPPDQVSVARYRFGLLLFIIPLLIGWLLPYFTQFLPEYESYRQIINVAGDLMFISSFFVLGGDFWDKLRGLFVHKAKITGMGNGTPDTEYRMKKD